MEHLQVTNFLKNGKHWETRDSKWNVETSQHVLAGLSSVDVADVCKRMFEENMAVAQNARLERKLVLAMSREKGIWNYKVRRSEKVKRTSLRHHAHMP